MWELLIVIRTLAVLGAVTFVMSAAVMPTAARAAEAPVAARPQIVIVGSDPAVVRTQVLHAADKLCAAAREQDPFEDFGSQDECIENSVAHARHVELPDSARSQEASRAP